MILFIRSKQFYYNIGSIDLTVSSIYLCLPRSHSIWKTVVDYQVEDGERIKLSKLESRYLTQTSHFQEQERISDFAEEDKDIEAVPSISRYQFTSAVSSSYTVLPSSFSLQAALDPSAKTSHKSSKAVRVQVTKKYRKAALKAKEAKSLQELAVTVSSCPLY